MIEATGLLIIGEGDDLATIIVDAEGSGYVVVLSHIIGSMAG